MREHFSTIVLALLLRGWLCAAQAISTDFFLYHFPDASLLVGRRCVE
ncbi:hypothetical protein SAMN05421858_3716 [Haladaptatus litoreus]|uniref:Uncharacterized protein n=1 Tax=Haladaptatus litoreus TaxID=553468 RepID=A0A1N7DL49_9EURY|nr:hypothetical protein SAMN05421858_3716 [Haladaptatus litoreus]